MIYLVTGSTSGIGKQIAEDLLKNGNEVVLNYANNDKQAKEVEKEFKNKAKNAASKNNNNSRSMEAKNGSRKKSSRNYGGNI